jgi:Rieske Fe-S protein
MPFTRRKLLLAGCALACGPQFEPLPTAVNVGNVSDLPEGTLKPVSGVPVAVGRDPNGIYAMSLECTHAGCDMSGGVTNTLIDCGCHGSRFDAQGNVLRGPASAPLPHFVVTADASGVLTVHTDQPTAESTRLPV